MTRQKRRRSFVVARKSVIFLGLGCVFFSLVAGVLFASQSGLQFDVRGRALTITSPESSVRRTPTPRPATAGTTITTSQLAPATPGPRSVSRGNGCSSDVQCFDGYFCAFSNGASTCQPVPGTLTGCTPGIHECRATTSYVCKSGPQYGETKFEPEETCFLGCDPATGKCAAPNPAAIQVKAEEQAPAPPPKLDVLPPESVTPPKSLSVSAVEVLSCSAQCAKNLARFLSCAAQCGQSQTSDAKKVTDQLVESGYIGGNENMPFVSFDPQQVEVSVVQSNTLSDTKEVCDATPGCKAALNGDFYAFKGGLVTNGPAFIDGQWTSSSGNSAFATVVIPQSGEPYVLNQCDVVNSSQCVVNGVYSGQVQMPTDNVQVAFSGYPQIMQDGNMTTCPNQGGACDTFSRSNAARTVVAVTSDGHIIAFQYYGTVYHAEDVIRAYNETHEQDIENAVNLDGGTSSNFYVPGQSNQASNTSNDAANVYQNIVISVPNAK